MVVKRSDGENREPDSDLLVKEKWVLSLAPTVIGLPLLVALDLVGSDAAGSSRPLWLVGLAALTVMMLVVIQPWRGVS